MNVSSPRLFDEQSRLATLRDYRILDTPREVALDDLVALAAEICETPMAMVSLVDEHRQWFKARVGSEVEETPRDNAFCAYALEQHDLLVVPDAKKDERFAGNPMVLGAPGIRYYAGAPLVTPEGVVLGTLCVVDRVPRQLKKQQMKSLEVIARQVMTHLELHRKARKLVGSEELFRTIFDVEPECVKVLSADGQLLMMNHAGLQLIEAESLEQIAGESAFPLVAAEHRAGFMAMTARVFGGAAESMKYRITGLKGTPHWLDIRCVPMRDESGEVSAMLGISRDVTEQHLAEQALEAKSLQLQAALKVADLGLWSWDFQRDVVSMLNPSGPISGLPADIVPQTGNAFFALVHPEDRAVVAERVRRAQTGEDFAFEFRIVPPGGEMRWVAARGRCLPDTVGDFVILTGVDMDITERKRSEESLRASEARFAAFFRANPAMIGINTLATGRIIDVNERLCDFFGWSRAELLEMTTLEMGIWADPAQREEVIARVHATGAVYDQEIRARRRNGEVFDTLASIVQVEVPGEPEPVLLTHMIDLTALRNAEAQLRLLESSVARLNDIVLITEAEPLAGHGPRILFVNDALPG